MFNSPALASPAQILQTSSTRPFALPKRPWAMAQTWQHLLFAHWPIPVDVLRPHIPPQLAIDTYEGEAWIGVVPFLMTGVRLRGLPPVPFTHTFLELNVRTYVVQQDKPGVWFFSLDAANPLAVTIARTTFHLPYFNARMGYEQVGDTIHYKSTRTHSGAAAAALRTSYRPLAPAQDYAPNSLERWLTERYVLYSADKRGRVYIGHIAHAPWPLHPAEADFEQNTMIHLASWHLPDTPPLLHYVPHLDILAWLIAPIGSAH